MGVLVVDTNVVSYFMRGDVRAEPYRALVAGQTLAVSFMTVAELLRGAFTGRWGEKRMGYLRTVLRGYVVLPYSIKVCEEWARIQLERRHQPIDCADCWIAANARSVGAPLVTHNAAHFSDIPGLNLISSTGSNG